MTSSVPPPSGNSSSDSDLEVNQNLKFTQEEKLGTISGSLWATEVTLGFKKPHINLMVCENVNSCKNYKLKAFFIHQVQTTDPGGRKWYPLCKVLYNIEM